MNAELLKVLKIAYRTSHAGGGLPLENAIEESGYKKLHQSINAEKIIDLIKENAQIQEEWLQYSEDKRTNSGWYINRSCEIGKLHSKDTIQKFSSSEEAVANYVVNEISFWFNQNG